MPDVKVEISAVTQAAENAMKRFEAGMEGIFRRLLAAASVTALAAFAGKLVNTADELYKMSQRVGIAVESLSAFRGIARLECPLPGGSHESGGDQLACSANVDVAPDAAASSRREADYVALSVDCFPNTVDPAEAERLIH